MAISNVNNTNKIVQLLKGKPTTRTRSAFTPEYMKMTGSIFSAPGVKDLQKPDDARVNIAQLNQQHSLEDLEHKKKGASKSGSIDYENIDSASEGKAAISKGNQIKSQVKSYTQETENNTGTVNKYAQSSLRLGKQIENDDKKFAAQFKKDEKQVKKETQNLQRQVKEQEQLQKEVDNAQHELDGLLASNSFRIGGSGGQGGSSQNSDRISELQTFIGAKVGLMQKNGKVIYSLQRNQNRALKRMNKTNTAYVKTNKANQKELKSQETTTQKIINVATKIEQYSAMAQSTGQLINLAGVALVALGESTGILSFGGTSVLIPIGKAMQKIGRVVELVGQYGQCAANVTKTAAYAADGNLLGAMQSVAMAFQSGAAAIQGTKGLKGEFGKIDKQAESAKKVAETKKEVKEKTKDAKTKDEVKKALGGKTKKEYIDDAISSSTYSDGTQMERNNYNLGERLKTLGSSMTGAVGIFMNNKMVSQMGASGRRGRLADYQLDARTLAIIEKNSRYRNRSYIY